jgi:hypothetical protein
VETTFRGGIGTELTIEQLAAADRPTRKASDHGCSQMNMPKGPYSKPGAVPSV